MTNVHIGNYGTVQNEIESDGMKISGLVCKNFTNLFSRKVNARPIQEYFLNEEMVGISDIDTRALVRHIRDKGAMNAIISSEETDVDKLQEQLKEVPDMSGQELSSKVSTEKPYVMGEKDASHKIAVLDLGVKKSILHNFNKRDCYLKVFPARTSFEDMEKWEPDGYFISNGPGDPAAMDYAVNTVKQILQNDKPLFGICLGHQVLALALDIPTYKMHHGHRGINHPVKNLDNGHCEITTQNHGFGVERSALEDSDQVEITHLNLNDDTVEGLRVNTKKAFSVQYHPESSPGPHDSRYLFDEFIKLMKGEKIYTTEVKDKVSPGEID
jgi:carbamoyl-phosphate synthase small subunit